MVASSLSDAQVETLLAGFKGSDRELEAVAGILAAVRDVAMPDPKADLSALFAAAARESRVTTIERFAREQATVARDRGPQLIQRVAVAGVALSVFVAMSSGLAYAADGAKPGDLMYGLDRALEAVGFSDGGATERLAEVEALLAAGAIPDGLYHAAALLDGNPASDEARAALTAAAARLEDAADSAGSRAAQFGDVIEYLQSAAQAGDLIGYLQIAVPSDEGVSGQTVAAMARELGGSQADPAGPPADPGSQADPAGPPADPGSQADPAGPPADPGSQADPAGPPADPGSKADPAGPPADPGSQNSDRGVPEKGRKEK